jgi:hypothetical protein
VSFTLQRHPVGCLTGDPPSSFDCKPPNRLSYSPPLDYPSDSTNRLSPPPLPSPLCR